MRFLIQKDTNRVYVRTAGLMKRGDMLPYEMPKSGKPVAPVVEEKIVVMPDPEPVVSGDELVKKWFDLPTSKVTKNMLEELGVDKFNIDLDKRQSKSNMIKDIQEQFELRQAGVEDFAADKQKFLENFTERAMFEKYAADTFGLTFNADDEKSFMISTIMDLEKKRYLGE